MKNYLKELLTARADGGIEAEELLVFPGLEELFSLFKITDIYEENQYDVLIVDCAPTGETLSLLKFPELFGNMIKTVLPMKKKAAKVAGPMVEKVMKIPVPEDNVFDDVEQLNEKLYRLQALMTDKEISASALSPLRNGLLLKRPNGISPICIYTTTTSMPSSSTRSIPSKPWTAISANGSISRSRGWKRFARAFLSCRFLP